MLILNKQPKGVFPGNYRGNIWQTLNMDFEKSEGRIRLSDKFRILTDADDTTLGIPKKFLRTNADTTDRWWVLTSANLAKTAGTTATASYTTDGLANSPSDPCDMEIHGTNAGEHRLIVTRTSEIAILNSSGADNVWDPDWGSTVKSLTLSSQTFHPLAHLQLLLGIGDGDTMHTIDQNDVVQTDRLVFPTGFSQRNLYATGDKFFIGLQHDFDGQAEILTWNGSNLSYDNEYKLLGSYPLTQFFVNDIPYAIDELGYIYRFNGRGYEVVQQFPIVEEKLTFQQSTADTGGPGISTYGTIVEKHLVYILIGGNLSSRRTRAGIWIFNTKNLNLYHYRGLGQHKSAGTDIDYGQSPLNRVGGMLFYNTELLAGANIYDNYTTGVRNAIFKTISNALSTGNEGRNRGYFITSYIPIKDIETMWEGLWIKFKSFVDSNNRIIVRWRVLDPLKNSNGTYSDVLQKSGTWATTTTFTCAVPTGVQIGDTVEVMAGANAGCVFNISTLSATPDNSATITVTIDEAAPNDPGDTEDDALFRFDNWHSETAISSVNIGNKKTTFSSIGHGEFIQFMVEMRGFDIQIDELEPLFKTKTAITQG